MRKSHLLKETIYANQMLSKQYEVLQKNYTDNAMLFHDMNNHLQTIYHLAEEAENTEIKNYVSRISAPVRDMSNILWTGVGIVDAILNEKKKLAEEKGYVFLIDAELPSNTGIAAEDFCTILTNLLDNAIESMDRQKLHDQKQIRISLRRIHHFLMIQVSNPCIEELQSKKGIFASLKADATKHGWGLKNVKRAVAKYNGNFSCNVTDGNFVAVAMLFFPL